MRLRSCQNKNDSWRGSTAVHSLGSVNDEALRSFMTSKAGNWGFPKLFSSRQMLLIVYREGDIVKQPMKKGSFVPKNVPGVGWGWVGHEGVGWGGS